MASIVIADISSYPVSLKAAETLVQRGHEVRVHTHASQAWADIERQAPDILVVSDMVVPDFVPTGSHPLFRYEVTKWKQRTSAPTQLIFVIHPSMDTPYALNWREVPYAAVVFVRSTSKNEMPDYCDVNNLISSIEQLIYRHFD